MTDIEIARACQMRPIVDVAKDAGILEDELELYGRYDVEINSVRNTVSLHWFSSDDEST